MKNYFLFLIRLKTNLKKKRKKELFEKFRHFFEGSDVYLDETLLETYETSWNEINNIFRGRLVDNDGKIVSEQALKFLKDIISKDEKLKVTYTVGKEYDINEFKDIEGIDEAEIEIREKIILFGAINSGKSALANTLAGKKLFKESNRSRSRNINEEPQEKEFVWKNEGKNIEFSIWEIPDFITAKINEEEKQAKLKEILDNNIIDHAFLVYKDRGEINDYIIPFYDFFYGNNDSSNLLSAENLTIIRVNFPEFEDEKVCWDDQQGLSNQTEKLKKIFDEIPLIHLDNPPLIGRDEAIRESEKNSGNISKKVTQLLNKGRTKFQARSRAKKRNWKFTGITFRIKNYRYLQRLNFRREKSTIPLRS